MKPKATLVGLLGVTLALLLSGCASMITYPQGGGVTTGVHGDAWYVRNEVVIFPVSSNIYYCDGNGGCRKAEIR